jgi:hypothetical protein
VRCVSQVAVDPTRPVLRKLQRRCAQFHARERGGVTTRTETKTKVTLQEFFAGLISHLSPPYESDSEEDLEQQN